MSGAIPHGGRLAEARRTYPSAPTPWLDLSTGINPEGWRRRREAAAARFFAVMGDRTIVLRSFGKFHGLAGARLVFVVANSELVARLRRWIVGRPVGTDANAMGIDF
ncbi:aminotransferase class I/II-fold pyridoxal phosphate-dependent enzyme [Brevundimonas sp. TWP2-3-4b1]|uniref:aminotransferase class I/II-fold pyridoxal phosphate-dependent enzyme n=1 Tax=Brevundimonas sp. TWP2-3-4b1 TaxID=2804580 RepID=UPI003CF7E2B7